MVFISILSLSCNKNKQEKLTIATAANMQFAMKALIKAFSSETGIECEPIISSSGKLTAQIKEGAPFHVFVSADMKYPTDLYNSGFTYSKPKIYAYGKLVLWSMVQDFELSIDVLAGDNVKHIALANPKTAPYGTAAIEVLNYYQLLEKVENKLVYGESISQTNQFITTTAAELGFTSKSVVLSPDIKGQGNWVAIDPDIYTPIEQGIVILKSSNEFFEEAQQFYNFLFSNKAQETLEKFGYLTKNN